MFNKIDVGIYVDASFYIESDADEVYWDNPDVVATADADTLKWEERDDWSPYLESDEIHLIHAELIKLRPYIREQLGKISIQQLFTLVEGIGDSVNNTIHLEGASVDIGEGRTVHFSFDLDIWNLTERS